MTNLPTRLRKIAEWYGECPDSDCMREAADELERKDAALRDIAARCDVLLATVRAIERAWKGAKP